MSAKRAISSGDSADPPAAVAEHATPPAALRPSTLIMFIPSLAILNAFLPLLAAPGAPLGHRGGFAFNGAIIDRAAISPADANEKEYEKEKEKLCMRSYVCARTRRKNSKRAPG